MDNRKEYVNKSLQKEKKNFLKIKKSLLDNNRTKNIFLSNISSKGRELFGIKPIYSGIVEKDNKFIDAYCNLNDYNEKKKKKIFDSSGEENYKKAFFYLLKETNNPPEEIEEMLKIRTSE